MRVKRKTIRSVLSLSIAIAVAGCATAPGGQSQQSRSAILPTANQSQLSNLDRARSEFSRGNYGNAIELLERELAQKPASVAALNGLGACYDQLGRYEVAQRYYFRALDLAPESSQTLSNIGYSYLQQGRNREAVAILELALQKSGTNQVAANNLEMAKAGLVSNAAPVQVARSSNNGSSIDEADFRTLMALLQSGANPASEVSVTGAESATGAASVVAVSAGSRPSTLVRMPQASSREPQPSVESVAIEADQAPADQIAEAAPEEHQVAILDTRSISNTSQQDDVEPEQESALESLAESAIDPAEAQSTSALSPAEPGTRAELALVTGQAVVVTPTLEPVAGNDPIREEAPQLQEEIPELTLTILDTPLPDPAKASDMPPPTLANLSQPLNLVIENGNGVRGIARATSKWLQGEKLDIKSVGDADNFDYAQTVIYYRPELFPYAQEIAASLALTCDLRPSDQLAAGADVQVVLGHDFASQVNVERNGLSFDSMPNTDYLASTLRLEIANGNGVNGMAARLRSYLRGKGGNVIRITDADNFNYQESLLYYRPGTRIAAEGLSDSLPVAGVRLIESNNLRPETDARLVIGSDFLPLDNLVLN